MPADPSENYKTTSIEFNALNSAGELIGCELSFSQIVREAPVIRFVDLEGSLAILISRPHELAMHLKLVPLDIRRSGNGEMHADRFNPRFGYAVLGRVSTAKKEAFTSHCGEGGFCAGFYSADVISSAIEAIAAGTVTVAYQRTPSGLDVSSTIDFASLGQMARNAQAGFLNCISELPERLE